MTNERMSLVCGSSNDYVMPMTTMLFSALTNTAKDEAVDIYIFDHGIRAVNRSKVEACLKQVSPCLSLHWCKPNHNFIQKIKTHAPLQVFDRFVLTKILPSSLKRVIFLDSDMIVQGDLKELWNEDFEDRAVLAVQDFYFQTSGRRFGDKLPSNVDPLLPYFNGGVEVCNLDFWRREGVEERLISNTLANQSWYNTPEQDASNVVFCNDTKFLDPRWNVQVSAVRKQSGKSQPKLVCEAVGLELSGWDNAKILHFITRDKPWLVMRFRWPQGKAFRQYYKVVKASGWFGAFTYWIWINRLRADLLKRQVTKIQSLYNSPELSPQMK